jgi:hypothetical protein
LGLVVLAASGSTAGFGLGECGDFAIGSSPLRATPLGAASLASVNFIMALVLQDIGDD